MKCLRLQSEHTYSVHSLTRLLMLPVACYGWTCVFYRNDSCRKQDPSTVSPHGGQCRRRVSLRQ